MSRRPREWLFRICAASAALAAAFHAAAMASPSVARIEYDPGYPAWRHVVFIAINGSLAWLFLRRPRWLVWPFALLTIEVVGGHGYRAWELWATARRVDWISIAVVLAAPSILLLLFLDRRDHDRERPASD